VRRAEPGCLRSRARRLSETAWRSLALPRSGLKFSTVLILAILLLAAPSTAAKKMTYGVNDGNFTSAWATMAPRISGLDLDQVGVWIRYHCQTDSDDWLVRGLPNGLGQVPRTQPVFVQLLGSASCTPKTNAERTAFARASRKLVLRYPNIRELQVWNEPDLAFWNGTVNDYVRLLAAVHDVLRGADVKLLGPGFSPNGLMNAPNAKMGVYTFARAVRSFYRANPRRQRPLLDGFSYHPYWGFDRKTTNRTARTLDVWWKGLPQRSPRRGLRFWWTETGAESVINTAPLNEFSLGGYTGTPNGWPERLHMMGDASFQANRVATIALKARANPLIVADFNFQLGDDWNLARWQSGLYFADGRPKPAYSFFRAAISRARR
jgi:hypothetical protein